MYYSPSLPPNMTTNLCLYQPCFWGKKFDKFTKCFCRTPVSWQIMILIKSLFSNKLMQCYLKKNSYLIIHAIHFTLIIYFTQNALNFQESGNLLNVLTFIICSVQVQHNLVDGFLVRNIQVLKYAYIRGLKHSGNKTIKNWLWFCLICLH